MPPPIPPVVAQEMGSAKSVSTKRAGSGEVSTTIAAERSLG
jgi:hypothetical protein